MQRQERRTVTDVRDALNEMARIAREIGIDTKDWDVFRGGSGYHLKVRWPGEQYAGSIFIGEHGADAYGKIVAITQGLKAAKDQLHNDSIVPVLRQAVLASHAIEKHAMTCSHCQCHVIGSPRYPEWCQQYKRMAAAYRAGLVAVGVLTSSS